MLIILISAAAGLALGRSFCRRLLRLEGAARVSALSARLGTLLWCLPLLVVGILVALSRTHGLVLCLAGGLGTLVGAVLGAGLPGAHRWRGACAGAACGLLTVITTVGLVSGAAADWPLLAAGPKHWRAVLGKGAHHVLRSSLRHPDRKVRREAIDALDGVGRDTALTFVKALDDPNVLVRNGALRALGKAKDERTVSAIVARLQKVGDEERTLVVDTLSKFRTPEAARSLMRAWAVRPREWVARPRKPDHHLETYLLRVQTALGGTDEEAESVLAQAAGGDELLRAGACASLSGSPSPGRVELLFRSLYDPSALVRRSCLRSLGRIAQRDRISAVQWMHFVITGGTAAVASNEEFGDVDLGHLGREVRRLIRDRDAGTRTRACAVVATLLDEETIWAGQRYDLRDPDLRTALPDRAGLLNAVAGVLGDSSDEVAAAAALTLAIAQDRRALPTLRRLDLATPYPENCPFCTALQVLGDREPVHTAPHRSLLRADSLWP